MQLLDEDYNTPEVARARYMMTARQYIAHLRANSDAERGKSGFHGLMARSNNRWEVHIGSVVCIPAPMHARLTAPSRHI